jgi:acyl-CoA synthetase (AMP-forming)/AMP-acid ligase II
LQLPGGDRVTAVTSAVISVTQRLAELAQLCPDQPAFTWLRFDGADHARYSYGELYRRANAVASALRARGLRGFPVLLMHPAGPEFTPAFFGALMAGAIAVPVPAPRFASQYERLESAARDCSPRAVISTPALYESIGSRMPADSILRRIPWFTNFDEQPSGDGLVAPHPDDIAFLQYTSGSTGNARGVAVSHLNLAHNVATISEEFNSSYSGGLLSWLPHFHDMGLIGSILAPMVRRTEIILMSPQAFLQRPLRWLEAIAEFGVELSGAPNFAYELCLKAADRAASPPRFDLSSWRIAFVGAEPIRASTLSRFAERFGPCGFRRSAFLPCYGLAEATLMVTCKPAGREYSTYRISRASLEKHVAHTAHDEPAVEFVGCGIAPPDTEVRIVDPESGEPLAPRSVGEVWVSGPQVTRGYWNQPSTPDTGASWTFLHGRRFLRTGDLGFLTEQGELVFVERMKDLLVLNGQNFACGDLEQTAAASHDSLSEDGVAVTLLETQSAPHLVVVAEIPFAQAAATDEIAHTIRGALYTVHGLAAKTIGFIPPGKLSRTTSGKLQRRRTVQRMVRGDIRVIAWRGEPIPDFVSLEKVSEPS